MPLVGVCQVPKEQTLTSLWSSRKESTDYRTVWFVLRLPECNTLCVKFRKCFGRRYSYKAFYSL